MSSNLFPLTPQSISSQNMISEWVATSLKESKSLNQNCEIEARLGRFELQSDHPTFALLKKLSFQSLIIIRTNSKYLC